MDENLQFVTNYRERRDTARRLRQNQTEAERRLWFRLRNKKINGFKFRRQFPIGPFFADFCCLEKRLIVEVDGDFHTAQNEEDSERTRLMTGWGFKVVRFWNEDVLHDIDQVCTNILKELNVLPTSIPLPEGEGGVSPGEAQ